MYKLFQVCFAPEHFRTVHPAFTPLDNTLNPFPELREYHCFGMLLNSKLTEGLDMWGMFSPKWNSKLKYPINQVKEAIDNNPGYDVYLFNHARVSDALTLNVWEQGETKHPGVTKVVKKALELAGYDSNVLKKITGKYTCYSSCFVASRQFWTEYFEFLTTMKEIMDKQLPPELAEIYLSPVNPDLDASLKLFPFIMERLLSTFLCLKQFNVYKKPYDFSVYDVPRGEKDFFNSLFSSLSGLKEHAITAESDEFYKYWDSFRKVTNMQFPTIMELDGDK